ncbi:hypothetical protein AGMMS49944_11440 [Spirochaetia bacterium]|nr:hypothetical protein AGMMS49944_11440 [Spirochaetia bacterium]
MIDDSFSNADPGNFADAVENILSYKTLRELSANDSSLAEQIDREIQAFIRKTKRELTQIGNPFETEQTYLREFEQIEKSNFQKIWDTTAPFLQETYEQTVFNMEFYYRQFHETLWLSEGKVPLHFESVKEHFTEKWGGLLFQKQTLWELKFIDEQRKEFCKELYKQIEELKKLQTLLAPFLGELGRLWDMSKGRRQKINLDILKKYAELLQHDTSLRELAEMLGRMHIVLKEYEEELFAGMVLKPDWKTGYAHKEDLIGIHESGDISSMLPSETALLADTTTEQLFYKKFAEKKLQTFEYQGKFLSEEEDRRMRQKAKEDKKGPFIICVDTSGSMHGTPETVAKTLCFAILKIAVMDNRKCYLISFSTGIETLNLTDMKNSFDKLIAFLSMSFHGGTDSMPAMHEALNMLKDGDYKKADVVMVSDFIMPAFDAQMQNDIRSAKENKTKFHSIMIGSSGNDSIIEDFDNNWIYDIHNKGCVVQMIKDIRKLA